MACFHGGETWKRFKRTTGRYVCQCKMFTFIVENIQNGTIDKHNLDEKYIDEVIDNISCNLFIDRSHSTYPETYEYIKQTLALAFVIENY